MEIIKEAGEQPRPRLHSRLAAELRPLLAVRGAGAAWWQGSGILLRRGWTLLSARLDGWERWGALAFGGYVLVYAAGHAPAVAQFAVPAAVVAWSAAAWWTAPPAVAFEEPVQDPAGPAADDARTAFVRWLLDTIGDRPGIHLRELYPAMRQLPGCERHDDARLRGALRAFQIPVHRSLRIGRDAGRSGVRKADLPPLSPTPGEPHVETSGDAGQSVDSPPLSAPVSAGGEDS